MGVVVETVAVVMVVLVVDLVGVVGVAFGREELACAGPLVVAVPSPWVVVDGDVAAAAEDDAVVA